MQNLESVIEGFLQAAEIDQTIILEIFGDGSERAHLENMLRRHGTTKVRFAGRIPMEKIMPLLEQAHALVLPLVGKGTVSKTIPAKLQAYLVAGRPIFAIMNGTVAKLVKENHLGQVADPSSISAIRDGFLSLASADPIELCSMGTTCREYVKKTFDRESTLESFLKMVL
jgi:glycosyltransferase involved in cell wall biosynthesis